MTGRPENKDREETPQTPARKAAQESRPTQAQVQSRPEARSTSASDLDSSKTQTSLEPINPDRAPVDADDEPTMIDVRYRHHRLQPPEEDEPDVKQDQLEAISFESSMATFSPARHESAYFDDQPSLSMSLAAIAEAAEQEKAEEAAEDDQPSIQMRALKS